MFIDKYTSLDFFSGLSGSDLNALLPLFTPSSYVAGTIIFEQGDRADNLYLVASGEVAIRYKPDDGPIMTVTRVQPGGIFGWSAAMGNSSYTSGASCSLDSEILYIHGDKLRWLCKENPRVGNVLLDRLSRVIAERQRDQQGQVSSILAEGIQQGSGTGGG